MIRTLVIAFCLFFASSHANVALVTGGAGFIGSHLCDRLISEGYEVYCLDNFYTGSKENIAHLLPDPQFHLIEHDITEQIPLDIPFDEIYNLACPASPVHYQAQPIETLKTAVIGTLHLLEYASTVGAKFFQASTSEVYGDAEVHPQPENYVGHVNPIGIRSCYDEGKRAGETLCFDFHREYNVRIKVGRIFNTYGPRMAIHDGRVVSNFITQALQGKPITIYGKGTQTRSFCYVDDLVEGIRSLMQTGDEVTGPMNLGNPSEFTMLELGELVKEKTESLSAFIYFPLPKDDPKVRRPDITFAKNEINWLPKVDISEGLSKTISYFENALRPTPERDLG